MGISKLLFLSFGGMEICHLAEWKSVIWRNGNLSFGGMEICHLAEWKSVIWRNRNRNYLVFSKYLCTFVKVF